jgi:hypothetical protein
MTTAYKLYNKRRNILLSPEGQTYTNSNNVETLKVAGLLFYSQEAAQAMRDKTISPKFKLIPIEV